MKTKNLVSLLLLLFSFLIHSCKKTLPPCTKNCVDISISGKVLVKTSGTALSNAPVELKWYYNGLCLFCSSYKVASAKTNANGSFNFTTTIDSSLFTNHSLVLRVFYDTASYFADPLNASPYNNYIEERFYSLKSISTQSSLFELYPKTSLTLNLHRVLNDNFTYFSVGHQFINRIGYGDYAIYGQQFAKDTTIQTKTSADVYTKITWRKNSGPGQFTEQTDSVLCTAAGPNVFNLNY